MAYSYHDSWTHDSMKRFFNFFFLLLPQYRCRAAILHALCALIRLYDIFGLEYGGHSCILNLFTAVAEIKGTL